MPKLQPLPASVNNDKNQDILKFLQGKSAHSDIADVLVEASAPLGDVQLYCSEPANYGYIVLTTQDVVFAVAYGMSQIGFCLDETFKGRALETGGFNATEVGPDWVTFELFRTNYPAVDLHILGAQGILDRTRSRPVLEDWPNATVSYLSRSGFK